MNQLQNNISTQKEQLFDIKFNTKIISAIIILLFFILLVLLLHSKFPIFMDEALYSDIANNFLKEKKFSTQLFKDFIPHVEDHSYWYPPIYFLVLATTYLLFGVSITTARLLSLFCGSLVLISVYFLTKHWYRSSKTIIITLIVLATDHYFQDGSTVARMEILTLLLGVFALQFHLNFLSKKTTTHNLASGIFSALSLLTHPTAAIFLIPIVTSLTFQKNEAWKKRITNLIIYGLPMVFGLSIWIASFWKNREIFLIQNIVQLHRKQYSSSFVIETFRYKYLHRMVLSLYYLSNLYFVISMSIKNKLKNSKTILLACLALTSSILPILFKEMWYLVYTSFFGAIILSINLENFLTSKKLKLFAILVIVIPVINSAIFFNRVNEINNSHNYFELSQKLVSYLPAGAKVLSASYPDPFFYIEKKRPDIQMRVTPNNPEKEPIDVDVYNKIFNDVDYIIASYFLNSYIYQYIEMNQEEILYDNFAETGKEKIWVIKLKDKELRSPIQSELTWTYPQLD